MTPKNVLPALAVTALLAVVACAAPSPDGSRSVTAPTPDGSPPAASSYVGMWLTADGHIRQELLPNGRYDEARGTRQSAYTGRYTVSGTRIDYVDDTGFTADGEFVDADTLHHGGYVFHREK